MNYLINLWVYFCIYSTLALSLNVITGYVGLINLSHAAYFGAGAYIASLLMVECHWSFFPAAAVAVVGTAVLSLIISLPALRLRGSMYVLITIAVQSAAFAICYNWVALTNGPYGVSGIPRPTMLGWDAASSIQVALTITAMTACVFVVLYLMLRSPWGRLLKAMRDDELAARSLGKNTPIVKLVAIAVSCAAAAVAGVSYAIYVGYIDPTSFMLEESILLLSMILIGGSGNFRGPIVGALAILAIREVLRMIEITGLDVHNTRMIVYGVLLIVIAHLRPQGLAGEYRFQ